MQWQNWISHRTGVGDKRQVLVSTAASLAGTNAVPVIVVFDDISYEQSKWIAIFILHWKGPVTGSVGEKLIRRQLEWRVGPQSVSCFSGASSKAL